MGFKPLEHQIAGIKFLAKRKRAYLFDDMGLGKTAQAIRGFEKAKAFTILIFCPTIAGVNWVRELNMWMSFDRSIFLFQKGTDCAPIGAAVYICPFSLVHKKAVQKSILSMQFDLAIVDEFHNLSNQDTMRAFYVLGSWPKFSKKSLLAKSKAVWALSGTPYGKSPADIWLPMRSITPEALRIKEGGLMSFEAFCQKYGKWESGYYGPKCVGLRNVKDLKRRLAPYALRRTSDVLGLELNFVQVSIEGKTDEIIKNAALQYPDVEALLDSGRAAASRLRRLLGLAKIDGTVKLLENDFENGIEKIVIFAYHRQVCEELQRRLKKFNPVLIMGGISQKEKVVAIDKFQNVKRCRVAIAQIIAASTAITLTAAQDVVIMEPSWLPRDNQQAAKRCCRIGTTKPVLARVVSLAGTLDDALTQVLVRRTRMLLKLL